MTCAEAEQEIVALLYDELTADQQQAVEAHIASCPQCRATQDAHGRTMQQLDTWPAMDTPADARTLTALAEAKAQSRFWKMRPALIGVAAAVVLFVILTSLGTTAEYRDGRLTLAIGRDEAPSQPTDEAGETEAMKQWVRAAVREEVEQGMAAVIAAVREDLADWDLRQEQGRRLLARAADWSRESDRQQYAEALHLLARDVALTTNEMAEGMDAVIQLVSSQGVPGAAGP